MSEEVAQPLPVALCLDGRRVLMVGGGDEAADKLPKLLAAGARVELVAESLPESCRALVRRGAAKWWARTLCEADLRGADVVILTDIDPVQAAGLAAQRRRHGFLFGAVDQPAYSDFHFVSVVRRGPLQIGISTGGQAPSLARQLRRSLEEGLDERFRGFVSQVVALRAVLRELPKEERVKRLGRALEGFALQLRVRYPERLPGSAEPHAHGGEDP
jgi:siroheme synthase-like protein